MNYTLELLNPFGAIIQNIGNNSSIEQFTVNQIAAWVSEYKLIVFKGYNTLPKQELALFQKTQSLGQSEGSPVQRTPRGRQQ